MKMVSNHNLLFKLLGLCLCASFRINRNQNRSVCNRGLTTTNINDLYKANEQIAIFALPTDFIIPKKCTSSTKVKNNLKLWVFSWCLLCKKRCTMKMVSNHNLLFKLLGLCLCASFRINRNQNRSVCNRGLTTTNINDLYKANEQIAIFALPTNFIIPKKCTSSTKVKNNLKLWVFSWCLCEIL